MEEKIPQGNYMETFKKERVNKRFPGAIKKVTRQESVFYFEGDEIILQVSVLSPKIFRFRYANNKIFEPDISYALNEKFIPEEALIEFTEDPVAYLLSTSELDCYINKETYALRILNKKGQIVQEDELGFHWEFNKENGSNIVINTKKLQGRESFYGLGDKPTNHNLRGKSLQNWGSDTYGYGKDTDPIYKNIPFYMGLHHKIGYGIFFDNTFRTHFDFGRERINVMSFWASGGEMNYYFIYGPQLLEVAETYAKMTGTPELPPMWALGYQQSKWSYFPEKVVYDLAEEFRNRKIPCDVIHLDIDYMDEFRCFTWNNEYFPKPKKLIADLDKDGFKTVVIIDPGIKVDENYWVYQEGLKGDYFCRTADGPLFRGSVWPGICNFPDFTNPKVRDWWEGLFKELIDSGVRGVWNDMNEPAVFEEGTFPSYIRHHYEGYPCSHRKAHNVYGMQMSKATNDGIKKYLGNKRPLTITRSTYSGGQRYAAVWTGDNVASWEHLTIANVQCHRLSISGISFCGSDVGGFIGTPSPELYIRWVQLAVFHPFFRTHSSRDHGDQEPWSFGKEAEDLVREHIELRYQLLPYLYTAFWQNVERGTPILKPLCFVDQSDFETQFRMEEFVCGDHILVCPISTEKSDGRWMYLPKGDWFHFWDDVHYNGYGEEVWIEADISRIPIFIKAGAVIPFYPKMQYVGEKKVEKPTLHVYFNMKKTKSEFYEDGGDGYEYKEGEFRLSTFTVSGDDNVFKIRQETTGTYVPTFDQYELQIHGLPFPVSKIKCDGGEMQDIEHDFSSPLKIDVHSDFSKINIFGVNSQDELDI